MSAGFQYPFAFGFHEDFDFASFFPGTANAALVAYLQHFVEQRDPFCVLWGQAGSGKTHLLQALCQSESSALYLPLAQLRAYGPEVLDGLAGHPLLVLDDIDVVIGQAEWEERLFTLFNTALNGRSKVCCASGIALGSLTFGLADLRSRLQLSVIFEVQPIDEATRPLLLQQLARRRGMELKNDVAEYLLSRHQRDLPALIAVLDQLDRSSLAERRRLTIPFIKEQLGW